MRIAQVDFPSDTDKLFTPEKFAIRYRFRCLSETPSSRTMSRSITYSRMLCKYTSGRDL